MLDARPLMTDTRATTASTDTANDLPPDLIGEQVGSWNDVPPSDVIEGAADISRDAPSGAALQHESVSGGWLEMSLLTRPQDRKRFAELSAAIADAPEAAANYLLRGELLLKRRLYVEAYDDLHHALGLANRALAGANWGIMDQVVQDRAAAGLNTLSRYLDIEGE